MTDTPASSEATGSIRAENGRGVVHMDEVYATDIDDLWSAITDPERLARWICEVRGDLRVGGEIWSRYTSGWEGASRIEVCERPHRLVLSSDQDGTVIEATLVAEGSGTRLTIEDRGLPLDEYQNHGAGWQAHVEDLRAHLEGRPTSDWAARWEALLPAYQEMARRNAAP